MSKLSVYIDIDTLFDTRRGILEHMLIKNGHAWERYEGIYKNRKLDFFDAPELGFTHTDYLHRFEQRDVEDWCDGKVCYFYPSKIVQEILPIVRTIEFGSVRTITIAEIELHVNMYPFDMSETLQVQLLKHLKAAFKIPLSVEIIDVKYDHQTANFIGQYNYVFRYGHLINPEFKAWYDTFPSSKIAGTKIIVPELFVKPVADIDELEMMKKETARTLIDKMSVIQGGKCIFIPLDKDLFDYIDR